MSISQLDVNCVGTRGTTVRGLRAAYAGAVGVPYSAYLSQSVGKTSFFPPHGAIIQ